MPVTRSAAGVALAIAVIVAAVAAPADAHESELLVGRSAAGQIKIVADLHHAVPLPQSIFSDIPGYAFGEPAFHPTILDDVANDFFQPSRRPTSSSSPPPLTPASVSTPPPARSG